MEKSDVFSCFYKVLLCGIFVQLVGEYNFYQIIYTYQFLFALTSCKNTDYIFNDLNMYRYFSFFFNFFDEEEMWDLSFV